GEGRRPRLYARTAYAYSDKLKAINAFKKSGELAMGVKAVFGDVTNPLEMKKLKKLNRERAHIERMCTDGNGSMQRSRQRVQCTVLSAEAEEQIVLWINSTRR
ncbi:hypothetical protein PHYSODRAFT_528744, partial [Phytophthora sojae]